MVWFDLHLLPSLDLSHQTPAPLFYAASAPVYATVSSPAFLLSSLRQQLWLLPPLLQRRLRRGSCLCCCLAYASTPAPLFSAASPGSQLLSMPPPRVHLISSLHCSIDSGSGSFLRCCVGSASPARRTPPPSWRRALDHARACPPRGARCSRGGLAPWASDGPGHSAARRASTWVVGVVASTSTPELLPPRLQMLPRLQLLSFLPPRLLAHSSMPLPRVQLFSSLHCSIDSGSSLCYLLRRL